MSAIQKGANVLITKESNEVNDLFVDVSWKIKSAIQPEPDIDASVFLIGPGTRSEKIRILSSTTMESMRPNRLFV